MAARMKYHPGQPVPVSGIYQRVMPDGLVALMGGVTCVQGEPFPPGPDEGWGYILVWPTPHRR